MKIAILGTRGIPNHYGGFEQFAEYLSVGLVQRGHDVTVYNSHLHPYEDNNYYGVTIRHIYDPENRIGTAGQFVYDFLCILDTRKSNYDIILQLGYTSSSIFFNFHPKHAIVVTNMDGLEWKRTKYSQKIQKFLQWAESLAIQKSNFLISDSIGIQNYLKNKYGVNSVYLPYGSHVIDKFDESICSDFNVEKYDYDMLIARLEPENSIEVILDGVAKSKKKRMFLVVGNYKTSYGKYLKSKFSAIAHIVFTGAIYDKTKLDSLRYFSNLYFHGHTVGGTNPSLLEAMGSQALICANDNEFNSTVLNSDAFYFKTSKDVTYTIDCIQKISYNDYLKNNLTKIQQLYEWDIIVDQYELFLKSTISNKKVS